MITATARSVKTLRQKMRAAKKNKNFSNKTPRKRCYISEAGKDPDIPSRKRDKES